MKKLLLIDGHSLIHRAYHAYPKTLSTRSGEQTNAVYGFTKMLLDAIAKLKPTHLAVAFDLPAPTFRHAVFVGYKARRIKPDEELIEQIPRVKEVVEALNIPIYEIEGYEADDLIGTLSQKAKKDGQVTILTSDRDLMQLIDHDRIVVKLPPRGKHQKRSNTSGKKGLTVENSDLWDQQRFTKEYGFPPKLLIEYKALAGDKSDDIPGVRGIGKVTAKKLVAEFGSLDSLYRAITHRGPASSPQARSSREQVLTASTLKKLIDDHDMAVTSKQLATIDCDAPLNLNWQETSVHEYDKTKVLELFDQLQFKSLVNQLPNDSFEQRVQEALF